MSQWLTPHHPSPRRHRLRPDRRLDRARGQGLGRGEDGGGDRRLRRCAKARARDRLRASPTRSSRPSAEAAKDADLIVVAVPVGACGAVAKEIGASLKPGAILSDVGSVKGSVARDMAPHRAEGRAFHPGASGRRHREFRARCRLRRIVRQPLVHPHAGRGHASRKRSRRCRPSGKRSAPMSRS